MPPHEHVPEWPDKAMFAAMLLSLGGILGVGFETIRETVVLGDSLPTFFVDTIPFYGLVASSLVAILGVRSLFSQTASHALLGALCAVASLAMFGLLSFFGVAALVLLAKSRFENEETRNDGIRMHGRLWPDKALGASLLLFCAGSLALLQGTLILFDRFDPILLKSAPVMVGILDVCAGVLMLVASRETFHLRRSWLGFAGGALACITLGLYIVGPILGLGALILLVLARKEGEFHPDPEVRAKHFQTMLLGSGRTP